MSALIAVGTVMLVPRIAQMGIRWIRGSVDAEAQTSSGAYNNSDNVYEGTADDWDFIGEGKYWKFKE